MKRIVGLAAALGLTGCMTDPDLAKEPHLTPVGAGLQGATLPFADATYRPPAQTGDPSLFRGSRIDLYRDPRAATVGDVLTVLISIDDKAKLDNSTDRTTTSQVGNGFDIAFGNDAASKKLNGQLNINSTSAATGAGNIDRKEKIQVSIAAVITSVLPNGNLVISGSQEIRVNFEVRQVEVAGIVRPRDISKDNTISYDKVAEARIAYGGRGRSSEALQPAWGQQIYDRIKPF